MQENVFYVRSNGRITGPFSVADLQRLVKRGVIARVDEVSSDRTSWARSAEYEELFPAPKVAVPPPMIPVNLEPDYGSNELQSVEKTHSQSQQTSGIASSPGLTSPMAAPRYACSVCGGLFPVGGVYDDNGTVICKRCFNERSSPSQSWPMQPRTLTYAPRPKQPAGTEGTGLIIAGYICAGISLLLCPPGFGLAGIVIGFINLARGAIGHGIAQIVISIGCALFGMILGAVMSSF